MISYSERIVFSAPALRVLDLATHFVKQLPTWWEKERHGTRWVPRHEPPPTLELRCHELARAVCQALRDRDVGLLVDLRVHDGQHGIVEHSWIEFQIDGRSTFHILDVYAVGRAPQVHLIDRWTVLPEHRLYQRGEDRTDINDRLVEDLVRWLANRSQAFVPCGAGAT